MLVDEFAYLMKKMMRGRLLGSTITLDSVAFVRKVAVVLEILRSASENETLT